MFDTDYRSFDLIWHAHCYLAEYLFDFPQALSWLTGVRLCFSLYPHQITTPSSSDFLLGFVLGCFGFHIRPPHRSAYFEIKVSPSPPLRFYHCCSPLAGLLGTLYLSQISFFPSLRRGISNPEAAGRGSRKAPEEEQRRVPDVILLGKRKRRRRKKPFCRRVPEWRNFFKVHKNTPGPKHLANPCQHGESVEFALLGYRQASGVHLPP